MDKKIEQDRKHATQLSKICKMLISRGTSDSNLLIPDTYSNHLPTWNWDCWSDSVSVTHSFFLSFSTPGQWQWIRGGPQPTEDPFIRQPLHQRPPPTTTPGAGSRRESPEYRHTTAPSQSLESPNPVPLRHLCPLCHLYPRSPRSSAPLRPRASPRLAVCLDPRAAGLPLHPSRSPTHPVSTAHFIDPQAAWPQAPEPPSLASPPLFDRMKISVHGNSKQRQEISYFPQCLVKLTSLEEWQQTSALVLLWFTYCKQIFICVYFLWSQFFFV